MSQKITLHSNKNSPNGKNAFKPKGSYSKNKVLTRPAVLHLIKDLKSGGNAREVVDFCIQTHRAGWKPLLSSSGGDLVLEAERAAVRHLKAPLHRQDLFSSWRARVKIQTWTQTEQPALIHAHGFDTVAVGLRLSLRNKLPFLIDLTEPIGVTASRQKLLQLAASHGAYFRVPSDYIARHLRQDFQLVTDRLYKISPGVDLHWFDATRVTPERLHKLSHSWRLPERSSVLLVGTPLLAGFGHQALLESLAEINKDDIYTVLIGNDYGKSVMRSTLEKQITELNLEGKVIIPDRCTDWPAACWLSSLVIATNTMPRGQANELLGAQAIGRPVVVTDCGANAEMVHPGETAWVVKQGDRAALTQALREAIQMTGTQRRHLADATRSFISHNYPMEFYRDSVFELYSSMLSLHKELKLEISAKAA